MQTDQIIENAANAIISFTDSYTNSNQGKQNEEPNSEPTQSLTDMVSSLHSLLFQIMKNNTSKSVIQIPKLLQSLSTLSRFKVGSHIDLDVDQERIDVRHWSRYCLHCIRRFGDAEVETELVNMGYGRVISMSFCTAGGNGEEQDVEIKIGLSQISDFLKALRKGRNVSFQVLLLRLRRTVEEIEEEGANEEIDVQMMNKENQWNIKSWANDTKEATLNRFIHKH